MDRPLRFCMITTFYPPYNFGGDGIFVHRLSNELAQRGHTVEIIHCLDAYYLRAPGKPRAAPPNHPNVTVHGIKSRFGFLSPLVTQQTGSPFFKSARIRGVLAKGFDVIHYHNISLVGGPRVLEYGQGIKLYTMHEYWLVCPTHVLFRYNRAPCTQPHCFPCSLVHRRPPQWWRTTGLLGSAVRHVDAFIAPSLFARDIHERMGLKLPVAHLPNFVHPIELAERDSSGVHGSAEPYFLFVGRLEKVKGLQTIIPLFRNYEKARLLIAGTGSYESRLRGMAEGSSRVRFLGYMDEEHLQPLYRRAVAVIVPSLCYEAFSLVMIEAFRQQTPAIVRNLGGMPEIIDESKGGITYNTNEELVSAMELLLTDSAARNQMGMSGCEAFRKKWTPEPHIRRYFDLIKDIAAARGQELE